MGRNVTTTTVPTPATDTVESPVLEAINDTPTYYVELLEDMLGMVQDGLPVTWPPGFDAITATQYVQRLTGSDGTNTS